jgi:hypothetical protein
VAALAAAPRIALACSPVAVEQTVFACTDSRAIEAVASARAVPLAVVPGDMAPLDAYRQTILTLSHRVKLVPLLFPGTPAEQAPPPGEGKREEKRRKTLTNGYLYTLEPGPALEWHRRLELSDLFDEQRLVLSRGDQHFELVRERGRYRHTDGPRRGERARLLLYDRVAPADAPPAPASAFDLDGLRLVSGIRRFEVHAVSPERASVTARFADGSAAKGSVIHDGTRTLLLLEGSADALSRAVTASRQATDVERGILAMAELMEAERLKFDEPIVEEGQQDGEVRRQWWRAYRNGRDRFTINGHRYSVFDSEGRPYVPQVCVDFLVDAIDRYGGSWYGTRDEPRRRTPGLIDLRQHAKDQGYDLRLVAHMQRMAREHPAIWDILEIAPDDRVPFRKRAQFHERLRDFPGGLREADIVVIYGLRDDGRNHYHSFFVHQTDPISGVPILFSENAGYVRVRVIDEIMRAAPKRSIKARLRLSTEWVRARMDERRAELERGTDKLEEPL